MSFTPAGERSDYLTIWRETASTFASDGAPGTRMDKGCRSVGACSAGYEAGPKLAGRTGAD